MPLFVILVHFLIDPKLIYFAHGKYLYHSVHVPGMTYFKSVIALPGNIDELLAAYLSRFFHFSWAGTCILTTLAGLLYLATRRFLTAIEAGQVHWLCYVPCILLLMQYGQYYHHLDGVIAVILGLLLFCTYSLVAPGKVLLRTSLFLILAVAGYMISQETGLLCILACGFYELTGTKGRAAGFAYLALALLIFLLSSPWVFKLGLLEGPFSAMHLEPDPAKRGAFLYLALFLFFPLVGFGSLLFGVFAAKRRLPGTRISQLMANYRSSKLKHLVSPLVLLVIVSACLFSTHAGVLRSKLRIEYFASNRMWSHLLEETHKIPLQEYNIFICHDANRALYHTGRLMYDLFSYPQLPYLLVLTSQLKVNASCIKRSELLYEMGDMNRAEHYAHDSLELVEYNPEALKLLAKITVAKRQPDSARVFLNLLREDFLHREWADHYLTKLEEDPFLTSDMEVRHARASMPIADAVTMLNTGYTYFAPLLKSNAHNRMAFEYYVTSLLLANQYDLVAGAASALGNYDYPLGTIPRHFQEALLVSRHASDGVPDAEDPRLDVGNIEKFNDFVRRIPEYPSKDEAGESLAGDFGDTYYYYSYFGKRMRW